MKRFCLMILSCLLIMTAMPAMASANSSSLISAAKGYLKAPYLYGGTTSSGFDCSGFTQRVFSDVGSSLPRTTGGQFGVGGHVDKGSLQAGDLVFFNTNGRGVSHVGIYVGSSNFIHASSSKGVMISSINDPYYWGSRYIGAKRPGGTPQAVAKPKTEKAPVVKVEEKKAQPKPVAAVKPKPVAAVKPAVQKPVTPPPPPVVVAEVEEVEEVDEIIKTDIGFYPLHPTAMQTIYIQLVRVDEKFNSKELPNAVL